MDGGFHKAGLEGCVKKHDVIGRRGLLDGVPGGARDAVAAFSCAQRTEVLAYLVQRGGRAVNKIAVCRSA